MDLPVVGDVPMVVALDGGGLAYAPITGAVEQAREDRRRRVIVLGRTGHTSLDFGREQGLRPQQIIHATPGSVRGFTGLDVVVLPGWQDRRDAEEVWQSLLPALACTRPRG